MQQQHNNSSEAEGSKYIFTYSLPKSSQTVTALTGCSVSQSSCCMQLDDTVLKTFSLARVFKVPAFSVTLLHLFASCLAASLRDY